MILDDPARGLIEIARPVGVVAAITPSTNPAATPANNIINALKGRNAIVLAPSPKGHSTLDLLLRIRPRRARPHRRAARSRACSLPVAGDAREDLRADAPGRPGRRHRLADERARGVRKRHAGDRRRASATSPSSSTRPPTSRDAAAKIARSKTFDNATSCSSENSVIAVDAIAERAARGAASGRAACCSMPPKRRSSSARCSPDGKLSQAFVAQDARGRSPQRRGLDAPGAAPTARFLIVDEDGRRVAAHPFSGEKLSPVLAFYRVPDFRSRAGAGRANCCATRVPAIRSGCTRARRTRALALGLALPVCRVIVNQAHCFATGGSFDNGLPFSLSMGCGTWGAQQLLRQPQLPPFPEHHARRPAASAGARAASRATTSSSARYRAKYGV